MKKLIAALALATLVASPALARTHVRSLKSTAAQAYAAVPRSGPVAINGQYAGQDPDPSIQFQLLRDANANQW